MTKGTEASEGFFNTDEPLKIEAGKEYALECGFKAIISVDDGDRNDMAFPLHGYYFDKCTKEWLANSWSLDGNSSLKGLRQYAIAGEWKEPRKLVRWAGFWQSGTSTNYMSLEDAQKAVTRANSGPADFVGIYRIEITEGQEDKPVIVREDV